MADFHQNRFNPQNSITDMERKESLIGILRILQPKMTRHSFTDAPIEEIITSVQSYLDLENKKTSVLKSRNDDLSKQLCLMNGEAVRDEDKKNKAAAESTDSVPADTPSPLVHALLPSMEQLGITAGVIKLTTEDERGFYANLRIICLTMVHNNEAFERENKRICYIIDQGEGGSSLGQMFES